MTESQVKIKNWTFRVEDEEAALELRSFLPSRIFDAHAHIYRTRDLNLSSASLFTEHVDEVGIDVWKQHQEKVFGSNKLAGGLFFPAPTPDVDFYAANRFLFSELERHPHSRGLALVHPESSRGQVEAYFEQRQMVGFKPYHIYSRHKPSWSSPLTGFVPEWMWQMADERKAIILIHLVKDRAVADPDNQREIRRLCEQYPQAKIVLAHCGRAFHGPHAAGVEALRGLDNVWFDLSGICEAESMERILEAFGPSKLMWGSDFPISEIRGKAVTYGDGFLWLTSSTLDEKNAMAHGKPLLTGIESLRVLRRASETFGLNRQDLEAIFHDNAARLSGVIPPQEPQVQTLYKQAKQLIPGGTQLLSKRPEMMAPNYWPAYFQEARGCEVWDTDGKRYIDMSTNGIGSCLLGFRDPDVTRAVKRRLMLGSMSTLNPPEEVELAGRLIALHPWAEQARFARSGGEACALAARLSRATTGRSVIAVCGYHGWQDWYLAANLGESDALHGHLLPGLNPAGVPAQLRGSTVTFAYNDKAALRQILAEHGSNLAAVVMEPCRYRDPEPGFLEWIRSVLNQCGALLVFDEITAGFRLSAGGAHLNYAVRPDIAVFAKALGNGHPIAAVIGTRAAMEGAQKSFVSSTYWTESIGPAAALAVLDKLERHDVPSHVRSIGEQVQTIWASAARRHQLPLVAEEGFPCFARFRFEHTEPQALKTWFTRLMLEKGFLAGPSIYPTLAHNEQVVEQYGQAVDEVFAEMSATLNKGDGIPISQEEIAHTGFARLI